MTAKKKPEQDYTGHEVVITREFDAPRELVFQAWTDSQQLAQWWGPRGFTNPVCDWHPLPGRAIYVVMRAPNGTEYPMAGEFREVAAPERLVFTSGALDETKQLLFEQLQTVTFAERDGKTLVKIHMRVLRTTAEGNKYLGGYEAGMGQSLERLAELMAECENPPPDTSDREIVITRVFNAPRELVWEAMTNPEHVVNWWGPRGFTTTIETMDVRPGGIWKHVMHGPDGTDYPNKSNIDEEVKPERIVYTHGGRKAGGPAAQFQAFWIFDDLGNQTRLTLRMVFPSAEARDTVVKVYGAIEGANQTFERLGEFLAGQAKT